MVKIEAIIHVRHFEEILNCLNELEIFMVNYYDVSSLGEDIHNKTIYRGVSHSSSFTQKIKFEIFTTNDKAIDFKDRLKFNFKEQENELPIEFFIIDIKEAHQFI